MATIDSKKLLPPSKKTAAIEKQKFLVPLKNISVKKISAGDLRPVDKETKSSEDLSIVKKKINQLSLLLNESYLIEKKDREARRKAEERRKFEQREKKLEEKVKKNQVSSNLIPSIPGQSIFDKINRFIGFTLLGYLFNKYGELLPKLIEFGKILKPVADFIESFAKNLLKGVVDFVEFGYKAYDQTRDFVKQIGGEGAQKTFDEFSKNFNLMLNGAIAASLLIASTKPPKPKGLPDGSGYATGYAAGYASGLAAGRGGRPGAGFKDPSRYRASGQASSGSFDLEQQRKKLTKESMLAPSGPRGPLDRIGRGIRRAGAQLETGTLFKKGAGIQKALYNAPGKIKGISGKIKGAMPKGVGKVFGRVPIIGGLIDFAINLALGEDPGRAAAKAVGSTMGAALGTLIPIPFAGTILGGILGDIVGGALYDSLAGSKKPQGRAEGGQISGGGQASVASSRRIKTTTRKAPPRIQPQKTQPGKDIGGKLKIEELYGEDQPGKRSVLRALRKSSEDVKKVKSINGLVGSMFGAGIDMALGQKPDKNLSRNLGNIFGSVISSAVDMELNKSFGDISKTIAMAGGGAVPSREIGRQLSIGERIGSFISRALAVSIESSATRIFQNLRNEMILEGGGTGDGPGPGGGDGGPGAGPSVSSDSADFWLLSLISLYENSNPQGAADVAQSIYNRMGYSGKSARQIILSRNQYEPVGKYGTVSDWNKVVDKESALNHIKKFGGNAASAKGLEKVAAALLDKSAQQKAAIFVGNRPDFRSDSYEKQYDDMTDDTSRYGQTFGFNRGSAYKGKSPVARPVPSLVKGSVSQPIAKGNVLTESQTVVVEGNFRLRSDAAQAYLAMKEAAKKDGVNLTLESAWRDSAKQAALYKAYLEGRGNLAAAPGSSNHEKGLAIDLRSGIPWAQKNCSRFGWANTGMTFSQKEPWHFDYTGGFVAKNKKDISNLYKQESKNKPSAIFNWEQSSIAPSQPQSPSVAFAGNEIRKTDTFTSVYYNNQVAILPMTMETA